SVVQQQHLAHAFKINQLKETELIKLKSLVKNQSNDLESRLRWARSLENLLKERTVWAKNLAHNNQQLQHQLNSEKQKKQMHTQQLEELKNILKQQTESFHAQVAEGQKLRENLEQSLHNKNQELIDTRHKLDDTFDQLQRAEHRAQEIENSTFWKLTAPMRWLVIRLKFLIIHPLKRLVRLSGRVIKSLSDRGLGGTIKHIKERRIEPEPVEEPQIEAVDLQEPRQPLVFSQAKHIDASIIIPVYGQSHHTYQCLKSLLETHNHSQFEVIVVDDCSIDDTPELLASIEGIKTHKNEQNLGFVGSCNKGLEFAEGDFVVYLNNDTTVTKGWLDALINTFTEHKDVGLVGAKLVYPDGSLQEAGGIIFHDGSGWNYGRNENPDDPRFNFVRETDYCSGAAIMARRDLLNKLGGFDQRYSPAYYEDTDLAFQIREQGLRVVYQPASVVVHYEGVSCGTDTSSGLKKYQLVNQQKFLERWKHELAQQFSPEQGAELARERHVKGRVLICDAVTPTPDQDSGSVRMVNIMRILKELNYAVSFIPENHSKSGKYTRNLQQMGIECLYQPFFKSPLEFFQSRGSDFDLIILSRHYVAEQYIDLIKQFSPRAKILFDTVDLHFLREQRFAELENSDKLRKRAEQTRQQEMKIANACHKTLVVSPIEVEVLAEQAPQLDVSVLSNVHEVYGCQNDFSSRRDIMFVGGYQHPPNVDAVLYFVEQIWPTVHAALPELKFRIIGSKMPDEIRQLEGQEGLEVVGFVELLEPELNQCRLAIAPLRYGAGVKGKVNMSMSYGQPVIATPIAVEGMHAQHEHDVMVADNPEDFAKCIIRAYQDEELWNTLSENALANVEQHFSFNAAKAALEKIIQD
ncbi:MAG: glycosyltransferase, partial [bacterium]